MMRERLLALAERRARLVASAQSERETISALLVPADAAASLVASVVRAARGLLDQAARYPLTVIAGMALLVALRPKRTVIWLSRGWSLWRLYRGARGWWLRFATPATRNAGYPGGAPR
jgi:hypothetical protein